MDAVGGMWRTNVALLDVMSPPLVITRDDVDHIVAVLRDAIVEVRAGLDDRG